MFMIAERLRNLFTQFAHHLNTVYYLHDNDLDNIFSWIANCRSLHVSVQRNLIFVQSVKETSVRACS